MRRSERYKAFLDYFSEHQPEAETELQYNNPFELLVAVILSAQCTDKRINMVTPALFRAYPDAERMALASPEELFEYIKSVSFPGNKSRHLAGMARKLVNDYQGQVPSDVNELQKLPGVGRKTANVIASVIYEAPAMAVDTHVFRVANRLGLTQAKNVLQSEKQLVKNLPEEKIYIAHHWLILHGRYICVARNPKCHICPLTHFCNYFAEVRLKGKPDRTPVLNSKKKSTPLGGQ